MKTHRLLIWAIIAGAVAVVAGPTALWAQLGTSPQTANLEVRASVAARCNVTTTAVDFGVYDPTSVTPTDADGAVIIQCTKGTAATIDMGLGNNFLSNSRRMASQTLATTEHLTYQLSHISAGGTDWGSLITGGNTYTYNAPDASAFNIAVHGRLNALQDVSVDDYLDIVVVTATF